MGPGCVKLCIEGDLPLAKPSQRIFYVVCTGACTGLRCSLEVAICRGP